MTLNEWTDIVARMTPEQREAMGYAIEARWMASYFGGYFGPEWLASALKIPDYARGLADLYPG